MEPIESQRIFTIEWEMMDKSRFFSFSLLNSLALRTILYPLTVIKTRLQIQKQHAYYRGTFDAFSKIIRFEGVCGLYKGYAINSIQIVSGLGYIWTYEKVRHSLDTQFGIKSSYWKGLIAGGCGSLIGQTIITPFDVVSQHMMLIGPKNGGNASMNSLKLTFETVNGKPVKVAPSIVKELYRRDGIKGFYRGYFASLNISVPSSALWWLFYPVYSDGLSYVLPIDLPRLLVYSIAGPLSGITVSIITNPLDVVRARIQVYRLNSIKEARKALWREERLGMLTKGLSARMAQSAISSFFIVVGYETLKRWSLYDQYKDQVRW